jgi:hypothetical protein
MGKTMRADYLLHLKLKGVMGARSMNRYSPWKSTAELCADDRLECQKKSDADEFWGCTDSCDSSSVRQCLCFVSCCFVVVENNVLLRGNVTNFLQLTLSGSSTTGSEEE